MAVCFGAAAPGEVVVGGRKLVGSAQRCERRSVLQHGSVLLGGGQERVFELLVGAERGARAFPAARPITLEELLGSPPEWPVLVAALRAGFQEMLGIRLARQRPSREERDRARRLAAVYRSAAWTERRRSLGTAGRR
ncbi:MAG: lipoate--protein ligase family protein [Gemmatimonadetes bacterium]|nr:lipoate--protein ligase family protein [Gemmatimonadota bacterium]